MAIFRNYSCLSFAENMYCRYSLEPLNLLKKEKKSSIPLYYMSRVMRKPIHWFPTWFDTNQAVQLQKMASGLKFRIQEEEGLYYLCSKSKGADQLRGTAKKISVFAFAYAKRWVSLDTAHI